MAKKSMVNREIKREKLATRYQAKRAELKKIIVIVVQSQLRRNSKTRRVLGTKIASFKLRRTLSIRCCINVSLCQVMEVFCACQNDDRQCCHPLLPIDDSVAFPFSRFQHNGSHVMILLAVSNRDEIFPKVLPMLSFPRVIPLVRRYMIGLAITQQLLQIFSNPC